MADPTEGIRRQMLAEIKAAPGSREYLEAKHGHVWDTSELARNFIVIGFAAPLVVVSRKSDNQKGSLMFQASPRFDRFPALNRIVRNTADRGRQGRLPWPLRRVGSVTGRNSRKRHVET